MSTDQQITLQSKKSFEQFHAAHINDKYTDFTISYYTSVQTRSTSSTQQIAAPITGGPSVHREVRAHRIILANHSDFFRTAFDNPNFRESGAARLDLFFEDTRAILPLILRYMYVGQMDVCAGNIVAVVHFADLLLCGELSVLAVRASRRIIQDCGRRWRTPGDAATTSSPPPQHVVVAAAADDDEQANTNTLLNLLRDAVFFEKTSMIADILDTLAPRFDQVDDTHDLGFLDYGTFGALVSHPRMVVESEYKLYQVIAKYVGQKRGSQASGMSGDEGAGVSPPHQKSTRATTVSTSRGSSRGNSYSSLFSDDVSVKGNVSQSTPQPLNPPTSTTTTTTSSSSQLSTPGTPSLLRPQITELYTHINWPQLSCTELQEAALSGLVPDKVLIKALLTSLASERDAASGQSQCAALGQSTVSSPIQTHTQQTIVGASRQTRKLRSQNTRVFGYSGVDFDTCGLVYFLGTGCGRIGTTTAVASGGGGGVGGGVMFGNPHVGGIVRVRMSEVLVGQPENLVSRRLLATCTSTTKNSWISIDFGASLDIKVSSYTLLHGSRTDKFNLRSWVLEGTNDINSITRTTPYHQEDQEHQNWQVILSHTRDGTLGGTHNSGTWFVHHDQTTTPLCLEGTKRGVCGPGADGYWRCLRVRALGKYPVQVGGFEFYGVVRSETRCL